MLGLATSLFGPLAIGFRLLLQLDGSFALLLGRLSLLLGRLPLLLGKLGATLLFYLLFFLLAPDRQHLESSADCTAPRATVPIALSPCLRR